MQDSKDKLSRPRLSVAMIVRNEEQVLSESLDSVRAIADEIVVLDTGSTDRTGKIAAASGAVCVQADWLRDFSAARNQCLSHVTGDWVLWLDAGEQLDRESAEGFRQFLDEQATASRAYVMIVQQPSADPAASAEQIAQLRLMPNSPHLHFEGRVAETLRPSIEAAGLEIDAAAGLIRCHARRNDPQRKAARALRNLGLVAMATTECGEPVPARLRLVEAEAHADLGDHHDARRAYQAVIEASDRGSTEILEAYYGLLTTYDGDSEVCRPEVEALADEQVKTCVEALEIHPLDAQLLLAMGHYLQARNRLDLAARSFEVAVQYGQVDLEIWHLVELAETAAVCLALAQHVQGQHEEARAVLERCLERHPDSVRVRRRLIDLHVKAGRSEEALAQVELLPIRPQERAPLVSAVRGACEAAAERWTPALGYLQSAYIEGCRDPLCFRWLAVTLLTNGQIEAAKPVLLEWERLEPANRELRAYLAAIRQQREAVGDDQQPADERYLRVDTGVAVMGGAAPQTPIVTQPTSGDVGA